MNKNQEELERIIKGSKIGQRALLEYLEEAEWIGDIMELCESILSAGYVKLSDVELDKSKLWEIVAKNLAGKTEDIYLGQRITDAIAQAKGIVKVKE